MYEYIVTAFKVVVGVITNERLAITALIGLGLMIIWVTFSLIFSFQARFARGAKNINNYISANGIKDDAEAGLKSLVAKMPSEFQRGFRNFEKNPNSLPSNHIKRFESLDVELSGGVFNQNRSILRTYINFVFISLLVFSLAILSTENALTGYAVAEALVTPLLFVFVAKIIYYVYTAIRQFQYRTAVDEFNDMLDNFDNAVLASRAKGAATIESKTTADMENGERFREEAKSRVYQPINIGEGIEKEENRAYNQIQSEANVSSYTITDNSFENMASQAIPTSETYEAEETKVSEPAEQPYSVKEAEPVGNTYEIPQVSSEEPVNQDDTYKATQETVENSNIPDEQVDSEESFASAEETIEPAEEEQEYEVEPSEPLNENKDTEEVIEDEQEAVEPVEEGNESAVEEPAEESADELDGAVGNEETATEETADEESVIEESEEEENMEDNKIQDNFKLNFASLLDEEEVEKPKRGRGRPKKEVNATGEFVITNDKEFEDALVRAEKLMRKNEEPLSASQTKRIEKQIKELVDAMTKYKEGK